jgi:hypothetical protein
MPKPVCVNCKLFYKIRKSGFYWVEMRPVGNETWTPYKLWSSDLWECKGCGAQILSGHGIQPVSAAHMTEFKDLIEKFRATQLEVKDC